jgi:prepilin-type processing-associated H-X9-DG protein
MNPGDSGTGGPKGDGTRPESVTTGSPPLDMQLGNSLNHSSEGQNVLYADGHVEWQSTPYGGENRGTNSNTWLDNIYTVAASNQSSTGGLVSGLPYDDRDAIMLPTQN